MKKMALLISLLVTTSLLLTSCGQASMTSIKVKMTDFSYSPMDFKISAGKEISLSITNDGKVDHEFVIMKKGTSVTAPFDADDEPNVFWEVEAKPGESKDVTFTAPSDAGEYQVVCGTPAHFEAGMIAKLTVVAP